MTHALTVTRCVQTYLAALPGLRRLVDDLLHVAPVGVFGGMIREAATLGTVANANDIDLVVEVRDSQVFEPLLADSLLTRNRFGGFRLLMDNTPVDVWALGQTWAIQNNHVRGRSLADLPHTTFLTCDSAVLSLADDRLHVTDGFSAWLCERLLDVQLRANPSTRERLAKRIDTITQRFPGVHFGNRLIEFLYT